MGLLLRLTCIAVLLLTGTMTRAATEKTHLDLSLGALADDVGGSGFDVGAVITPGTRWSFALGVGSSNTGTALGTTTPKLQGSSFNAGIDFKLRRFGLGAGFSHWHDDDEFSAATPQLRASWRLGGLRTQLLYERPNFAQDYQLSLVNQTIARQFDFSGDGIGAGLDWLGDHWSGYFNYMSYSFGSELTRARAILSAPNLQRLPRLALLSASIATLTRGALHERADAGVEYAFIRSSVHADLSSVTDAISQARSASYSLGISYVVSERFSVDLDGGISHADGQKAAKYASTTLYLHW